MTLLTQEFLRQWSQIQVADSLSETITAPFLEGKNLILCERPELRAKADFKALTSELIDMLKLPNGDSKKLNLRALKTVSKDLSARNKITADLILKDFETLSGHLKRGGLIELRLQSAGYQSENQDWHNDSGSPKKVGIRYAGSQTEEVHNEDVLSFGGDRQMSVVRENPRIMRPNHGDIWAHQGYGALSFKFSKTFPFFEGKKPAVHRQGPPNDEPGLILVADYL